MPMNLWHALDGLLSFCLASASRLGISIGFLLEERRGRLTHVELRQRSVQEVFGVGSGVDVEELQLSSGSVECGSVILGLVLLPIGQRHRDHVQCSPWPQVVRVNCLADDTGDMGPACSLCCVNSNLRCRHRHVWLFLELKAP